jgi:hypothetical protein
MNNTAWNRGETPEESFNNLSLREILDAVCPDAWRKRSRDRVEFWRSLAGFARSHLKSQASRQLTAQSVKFA